MASETIEQLTEVIREAMRLYSDNPRQSVRSLRISAAHTVADRRQITFQSVADKYIRELRPEISGAPDFDRHLENWLRHGSLKLRDILQKHSNGPHGSDADLIAGVFVS